MGECRLCGKGPLQVEGWLERVNEKGVPGIWECRPDCNSKLSSDEAVVGAVNGATQEPSHG